MTDANPLPVDRDLTLRDLHQVARQGRPVAVSDDARHAMRRARERVDNWIDESRLIYGLTTGFGPLASETIDADRHAELQSGLVEHLSSGVGDPMPTAHARAMMLARLSSLTQGHSAVSPTTAELLAAFLNHHITPVIPQIGTVGASGDLTPLAHMARAMMGRGHVRFDDDSDRHPANAAFRQLDTTPMDAEGRDALALVNGTSAMTGIAALNAVDAIRALDTGLRLALLNAEIFHARDEAWDATLGELRPHPGQRLVHRHLRDLTRSSDRLRGPDQRHQSRDTTPDDEPLQDRYSIRCIPQIFGAILDELHHHNRTAATELNAVTDNPIIDADHDRAIHGGNFYGQHIAFASDHLASASLKLGIHAERLVSRLCDPDDNHQLPPFLQPNEPGIRSGFMGAQVTATSLVGEMRTHSTPASTQSISTNADNQDVVPMGTTAARRAADHLEHLWDILAIEALALTQAFDLCDGFEDDDFCDASRSLADSVRDVSPALIEDRSLSADIQRVKRQLRSRPAHLPIQPPPARSDDGTSS